MSRRTRHAATLALALLPAAAVAQPTIERLAHIEYPGQLCSAIWGYSAPDGTELAIVGTYLGTSFVDASDPRAPFEVGFIPGNSSIVREIQTHDHYAYIVTEGGGTRRGLQIVDLADPHHPVEIAGFDSTFSTAHTLHIRDGLAFINGSKFDNLASGMRILDLWQPRRPREVGVWSDRYVHDCYVRGGVAYVANIYAGITILDVRDPGSPLELSFTTYPEFATHNCALSRDGTHLFTTDEKVPGGYLRVWDVSNSGAPVQVGSWQTDPEATIHNVYVRGDSAYVAYYTEGLYVLDVTDPRRPREVGHYDTWPGVPGGYNGAWGAYPYTRSGVVYVSDRQSGLFILRCVPQTAVELQDFAAEDCGDGSIRLRWRLARDARDRGQIAILRAEGSGTFAELGRSNLEVTEWRDADVRPGVAYRYALALDDGQSRRVLGERSVQLEPPARSRLVGVAPTPFDDRTAVSFQVARPGDAALFVYDARGALVHRDVRRDLTPGTHAFVWDAARSGLPGGTYFLEVRGAGWRAEGRVTRGGSVR